MNIVWFDLETTGLEIGTDEIIQAAFVATTGAPEFRIREKIEIKIKPSEDGVGRIKRMVEGGFQSVWDAETWAKAWTRKAGLKRMCSFMSKYADVKKVSKRSGKSYKVCRLAGHNIAKFDTRFLYAEGKRHDIFVPADAIMLDTFQLAASLKIMLRTDLQGLSIEALCKHYGIKLGKLHDALDDVCMNIEIGRKLAQELADWE